jgi:hypothetical protein
MLQKQDGKTKKDDLASSTKSNRKPRREDLKFIPEAPPTYNLYCFFHNWVNKLLEEKEPQENNNPTSKL